MRAIRPGWGFLFRIVKFAFLGMVVFVVAISLFLLWDRTRRKVVPLEIKTLRLGSEARAYYVDDVISYVKLGLNPQASVSDLVDLSPFAGLSLGAEPAEQAPELGEPLDATVDGFPARVWHRSTGDLAALRMPDSGKGHWSFTWLPHEKHPTRWIATELWEEIVGWPVPLDQEFSVSLGPAGAPGCHVWLEFEASLLQRFSLNGICEPELEQNLEP